MTQSVEALLDPAGESLLLAEWDRLADAGLPSSRRAVPSPTHRPHVTLLALDALPAGAEDAVAAAVAGVSLRVRLGPVVIFGPHRDRYVLVRGVVPSPELLDLQQRVAVAAGAGDHPHFGRGRWTPHLTLAPRVDRVRLPEVLEVLGEGPAGSEVQVSRFRRWDSDGRRAWPLGDG
ncbi:MAG: hypothetical protein JWP61_454 [Friedmanniella sp.]|nr:hypothetical protein [Friedmanniella sp.]